MQSLNLYLVQADLAWENREENLRHIGSLIDSIPDNGLVLLPEMFASGFSMNTSKVAEDMDGISVSWLKEKSKGKAICGSLSIADSGVYYNRLLWAEDGEIKYFYNKRHLFFARQRIEILLAWK